MDFQHYITQIRQMGERWAPVSECLDRIGRGMDDLAIRLNAIGAQNESNTAVADLMYTEIPYAATVTPVVNLSVKTQVWYMALAGSCTFAFPYGGAAGTHFILRIKQDATGNRVLAFAIPYNLPLTWEPSGEPNKSCIIEGYFLSDTEAYITNLQGSI